MLVKEIMRTDVKTIREDDTVNKAAEIMNQFHIGGLVVVSGSGEVAGIVTERDILVDVVAKGKKSFDVKVEEIMTKSDDMIYVEPEASLEDAADAMTKYKIKRLPVLSDGGLVGIITATDLIAYERHLVEKVSQLIALKRNENAAGG